MDMDFFTFLDIINKFIKSGGKKVSIIGGEPAIWKHINKAIKYCKLRGLEINVLSNGLATIKSVPDSIGMNVSYFLDKKRSQNFLDSVGYYSRKGVKIVLRYNIVSGFSREDCERIAKIAKEFKVSIDIVPTVPYEPNREVGNSFFQTYNFFKDLGILCSTSNPLPPCMFTEDQLEYLKNRIKLFFKCGIGKIILIHPDGKTVQPCTKAFIPKNIEDYKWSFEEITKDYREDIVLLNKRVPEKCKQCDYFERGECFGGCVAFR